jgi:flagellar motor switch protein FliM
MISLVTLKIKVGNIEGLMNICLPYVCLEKVIDKLNTKYWYSTMQLRDDKSYKDLIEVAISKAKVPLRAVLGKSTISVNDFMNMQSGDIIKLNSKVDDELSVYVGNLFKFTALPGASSGSYAVKISTIIRGEE